ncbi:MAG: glycosyltransferase [Oscillospiraceae bacterium]|nr:glycosyltransferase [Oscillospiraceae bacterium]
MSDLISVIVPIYKVEEYLDECIQSIAGQSHRNLEIILVDDGSPDGCGAICDVWAARDSRVKVIHKPNGGLSDARNAGLEIASGDFIAFVDSDDRIEPEMYEKMLAALLGEDADICACRIVSCFPDHRTEWGCPDYRVTNPEQTLTMLYADTAYPVSAWNKLYRRACWRELRFPVGRICEDAFTTYQLIHGAKRIVQIPEALYCYRIRPESIMTSAFSPRRMDEEAAWRANYEFVREHYPAISRQAHDFYLEKVNVLIHAIGPEEREKFAVEFAMLRHILCRSMPYIVLCSGLSLKKRVKMLLDYFML